MLACTGYQNQWVCSIRVLCMSLETILCVLISKVANESWAETWSCLWRTCDNCRLTRYLSSASYQCLPQSFEVLDSWHILQCTHQISEALSGKETTSQSLGQANNYSLKIANVFQSSSTSYHNINKMWHFELKNEILDSI